MKLTDHPDASPSSPGSPSPPPFIIAPLWRRLAAMLYDAILITAMSIIVSGVMVLAVFGIEAFEEVGTMSAAQRLLQYAVVLLSAFLFFGFFWTHSGQTLGMQAWRIRIQNADGSAISWMQSLLRFGSAPFSLLALGMGYLWMLFDKQRRTLPDIVSRSQVVRVPH